jgi:hypothetical protein
MGTKSNRSSGTQYNPKGATQGNTLVDPNTGLPISVIEDSEGNRRLAVDAKITAQVGQVNVDLDFNEDSVHLGDPNTGATLKVNPDGSIDVNTQIDAVSGDNIAIKDPNNGNTLKVNPDGSINTNIISQTINTPVIANINSVLANTEYNYTFPTNTKKFKFKARGNSKIQFSFVTGQTDKQYITIHPGGIYEETGLGSNVTIYFQTSKANEIIEILSWS